jgi:hypothetical protein
MESTSQLFPDIRVSCVVKGCRHMSRVTGKPLHVKWLHKENGSIGNLIITARLTDFTRQITPVISGSDYARKQNRTY